MRKANTMHALLQNLEGFTHREFDLTQAEFDKLLAAQHAKQPVEITCEGACCVDGNFEHDFHDIRLKDGTEFAALSGYHLLQLDSE